MAVWPAPWTVSPSGGWNRNDDANVPTAPSVDSDGNVDPPAGALGSDGRSASGLTHALTVKVFVTSRYGAAGGARNALGPNSGTAPRPTAGARSPASAPD